MPRQTYCVVRGIRCHVSPLNVRARRCASSFTCRSLPFFVRLSVVALLRSLVGWSVGWYCPSSFACLSLVFFLPSFLPSLVVRLFPLVVGRRSSFVSSSLVDLLSLVRWL
jgi:hypothetical protein